MQVISSPADEVGVPSNLGANDGLKTILQVNICSVNAGRVCIHVLDVSGVEILSIQLKAPRTCLVDSIQTHIFSSKCMPVD